MTKKNNIDSFIEIRYDKLKNDVRRIARLADDYVVDELLHSVLTQLLKKRNTHADLTHDELNYLFVKMVQLNYYSSSSPFFYEFNKWEHRNSPLSDDYDEVDPGEDDYKWAEEIDYLYQRIHQTDIKWFDRELFKLYFEGGNNKKKITYREMADKTGISVNTICKSIKKTKDLLNKEYKQKGE